MKNETSPRTVSAVWAGTRLFEGVSKSTWRHGQRFDYDGLIDEAKLAVKQSGRRRKVIAAELGVTPSALTHALKQSGSKYSSLQCRIIKHLTGYQMTESTTFQAARG